MSTQTQSRAENQAEPIQNPLVCVGPCVSQVTNLWSFGGLFRLLVKEQAASLMSKSVSY